MNPISVVVIYIILLWVFFKTLGYGKWTWDQKNKPGAIAIVVIAIAELVLPIYSIYFAQ